MSSSLLFDTSESARYERNKVTHAIRDGFIAYDIVNDNILIYNESEAAELDRELALEMLRRSHNNVAQRANYNMDAVVYPESLVDGYSDSKLDMLLIHAYEQGANDIILGQGRPALIRKNNITYNLSRSTELIDDGIMQAIAKKVCNGTVYQSAHNRSKAFDTRYLIKRVTKEGNEKSYSFRVNNSRTTRGMEITMRCINDKPRTDNTLPKDMVSTFYMADGIILVVGRTGTGKSTLLSSIMTVKVYDSTRSFRIVTGEAPPEFNYDNILQYATIITQSSIPEDFATFHEWLEAALRRAPTDIMVGEMRDKETLSAGLLGAQTGHLVYSTMHVNNVADTIPRIISQLQDNSMVFQILRQLRMVISQDLVKTYDEEGNVNGRVAVREYLKYTLEIQDKIQNELSTPEKMSYFIDELVFKEGVHFSVHARFLYRNRQITIDTLREFMQSRNFRITNENFHRLDKRVDELVAEGNAMFTFTTPNPLGSVIMQENGEFFNPDPNAEYLLRKY